MSILLFIDRLLTRIEVVFLVLFLSAMVVLSFTQVVLRNLFDTGLLWADPIVRHLVIWGGFTAAAIAAAEGRHIGIDALTKFFSPRLKSAAAVLTNLFAVVACWYLSTAAWTFLLAEKEAGDHMVLSIPTWVAILIIPCGYLLMAIHFLVKTITSAGETLHPAGKGGA